MGYVTFTAAIEDTTVVRRSSKHLIYTFRGQSVDLSPHWQEGCPSLAKPEAAQPHAQAHHEMLGVHDEETDEEAVEEPELEVEPEPPIHQLHAETLPTGWIVQSQTEGEAKISTLCCAGNGRARVIVGTGGPPPQDAALAELRRLCGSIAILYVSTPRMDE